MKKNNKGFTLVELIVVLVILAILAAILVPTLLGWIDKARSEKDYSTAQTSEPTTYVIGDANGQILYNAMRRISKEDFNDRYVALVPPDPTDSSSMTWVLG